MDDKESSVQRFPLLLKESMQKRLQHYQPKDDDSYAVLFPWYLELHYTQTNVEPFT